MPRYSSFEVDLALVGGTDKRSTRSLDWPGFVEHWKAALPPAPARPFFSTRRHRLEWRPAWQAPPEWSTALWPDFAFGTADDAIDKPVPILRMALDDVARVSAGAKEAFEFLLAAGVRSNVWPGHGATVISRACLIGHLPCMAALYGHGHDFQALLPMDGDVRDEFRGSTLLHRVGPAMARRAQNSLSAPGAKAARHHRDRADRLRHALEFLVRYVPDPEAVDALGRSALAMVAKAGPSLAADLEALGARRRAEGLLARLGATDSPLASRSRDWVLKGAAHQAGEPMVFAAPVQQGQAWRLARTASAAPGDGAVWLRAHQVCKTRELLDADQAAALAREQNADAVACGRGEGAVWWAFHPGQMRPALLPPVASPAPRAPSRSRL